MNTISLAPTARRTIEREAVASSNGKETGGILLGFDADDDQPLAVVELAIPDPTRSDDEIS